jgi:zinc transporter, ZIP family
VCRRKTVQANLKKMNEILFKVLSFALLPMIAATIGAIIATFRPPNSKVRSILQHFAAGVVFSVVAVELLPDVMKEHNAVATSIGFALGVAAMLGIKKLTASGEEESSDEKLAENKVSKAMLVAIGVDILIDGFLLGLGFIAGAKEGKLLAFALTTELLSLGLALACTLTNTKVTRTKSIGIVAGLSSLILVGAIIGATVLQQLSKEILEVVLSFGLAALLYLVTEELLVEAHEEPETPLITSTFFAGFLLFLILGMTI